MKKPTIESVISTFFGIGKIPILPGTFGSLAATILVALLFYQPHFVNKQGTDYLEMGAVLISPNYIIYVLILLSVLLYVIGVWASERYSKAINIKDPSSVVIDEVAGIFCAFSIIALVYALLIIFFEKDFILYLMLSMAYFPIVFILFRIFDMVKPWHVGRVDKKYEGGFGIMIDDIVAAIYTAISFYIIFFGLKFSGMLDRMIETENLDKINNSVGKAFEVLLYIPYQIYLILN